MSISDTCTYVHCTIELIERNEIHVPCDKSVYKQLLSPAQHDLILLGNFVQNVPRSLGAYTEPLTLTYRIADDALMLGNVVPVCVNKVAGRKIVLTPTFKKSAVVSVLNKADILTVTLGKHG